MRRVRRFRACPASSGFTLIELLIVVGIIGILASVVIPGLLRARTTGRETAAIATLRAVNDAQASYASVCGNGCYAVLFPTLAVGPRGSSTGFLSPDLSSSETPVKSGYRYGLAAGAGGTPGQGDWNGTPTNTAYYVSPFPWRPVALEDSRRIKSVRSGRTSQAPLRPSLSPSAPAFRNSPSAE
jgi:prepilin-type N-terminal cleavage/methylation domain-containing protein